LEALDYIELGRYGVVRLLQRLPLEDQHEQKGTEARIRLPYLAPLLAGEGRKAKLQYKTGGRASTQPGSDILGEEAHGPGHLLARDAAADIGLNDHA